MQNKVNRNSSESHHPEIAVLIFWGVFFHVFFIISLSFYPWKIPVIFLNSPHCVETQGTF